MFPTNPINVKKRGLTPFCARSFEISRTNTKSFVKIYAKINISGIGDRLLRNDDLILRELGQECRSGWHKFEISSEILRDTYRISAERGVKIGAYVTPTFTPKEKKQFTHYVPGFSAIKMTEKQDRHYWFQIKDTELRYLGGIGKVRIIEKVNLKSPIQIGDSEIRRINYQGDELITTASFYKHLEKIEAGFSDCTIVGNSKSGEEVLLLKTQNFASSVVMNETITDRLGFEEEANKMEYRYNQSGSRCYVNLSSFGLMARTIDPLSMQLSPPWIINTEMANFLENNKMFMRLDPVFQIGTSICEEYLSEWREFLSIALLNPQNYVKYG